MKNAVSNAQQIVLNVIARIMPTNEKGFGHKGVKAVLETDTSYAFIVDKAFRVPVGTPEVRRVQPGDVYVDAKTGRKVVAEGYKLRNGKFGSMSVEALTERPKGAWLKQRMPDGSIHTHIVQLPGETEEMVREQAPMTFSQDSQF